MRPAGLMWIALAACGGAPRPVFEPSDAGPVRWIDAHRHAVALWHDVDTWVSLQVQDDSCKLSPSDAQCATRKEWTRKARVRVSHGNQPIRDSVDVDGVIGVRGGRVYTKLYDRGSHDEVYVVDGASHLIGKVPAFTHGLADITNAGEVVLAGLTLTLPELCNEPACAASGGAIVILGTSGARLFPIARDGETVRGLAADPTGSRIAVALGAPSGGRVVELDPTTGAVLAEHAFPAFGDDDGALEYAGDLWIRRDHGVERWHDGGRVARHPLPDDAGALRFSDDGRSVAYATTQSGAMFHSTWCDVYYARVEALATAKPVYHTDGACRLGYAIAGDTLWLTPDH